MEESKASQRLSKRVKRMIGRMDKIILELEKDKTILDGQIDSGSTPPVGYVRNMMLHFNSDLVKYACIYLVL